MAATGKKKSTTSKRGGARPGAGRKPTYDLQTKIERGMRLTPLQTEEAIAQGLIKPVSSRFSARGIRHGKATQAAATALQRRPKTPAPSPADDDYAELFGTGNEADNYLGWPDGRRLK